MFERYVFIELPGINSPVAAGLFTLDTDLGVGRFSYGRKYLTRKVAIAIDPVNLPLGENEFIIKKNHGIFFCLADLFPDSWGKYVLSKKLKIPFGALQPHDYFDLATDNAVGALSISKTLDHHDGKVESTFSYQEIRKIITAYQTLTADEDLPDEVLYVLEQGTSLGGAQPKSPIIYKGEEWIAKFRNSHVPINLPCIEYATMSLAKKCGIDIPEIALEEIDGEKVYLIKRFDRKKEKKIPFISGHALSSLDIDSLEMGSYLMLARFIRQISGKTSDDLRQLFRRMIFNIAVGNADDHLRNHGWLYSSEQKWRLSPAYDILPIPRKVDHFSLSLVIGDYGTSATFENALSQCENFNLSEKEGKWIIGEITDKVKDWKVHFDQNGVSKHDLKEVSRCFQDIRRRS